MCCPGVNRKKGDKLFFLLRTDRYIFFSLHSLSQTHPDLKPPSDNTSGNSNTNNNSNNTSNSSHSSFTLPLSSFDSVYADAIQEKMQAIATQHAQGTLCYLIFYYFVIYLFSFVFCSFMFVIISLLFSIFFLLDYVLLQEFSVLFCYCM